jgi:DNA-binding NtrC family response regulator
LLHRIAVARIELPPLRRRKGDVLVLARHFCQELGGSDQALAQAMRLGWDEHPWSGNVRELRSTVARHLALGELAELTSEEPAAGVEPVSVDQIIEQALDLAARRSQATRGRGVRTPLRASRAGPALGATSRTRRRAQAWRAATSRFLKARLEKRRKEG